MEILREGGRPSEGVDRAATPISGWGAGDGDPPAYPRRSDKAWMSCRDQMRGFLTLR
jgi:hypothetical protein